MERQRSVYLKIIIVAAVLITLNAVFLRNAFQSLVFRAISEPVVFFENRLRGGRIAELQRERDELLGAVVSVEALERENDALRRQLGVEQRPRVELVSARAFSAQRTTLVSTIMIDKGGADGLASGMVVVAPGNILIGKIGEAFDHSSRVIMADDPRSSISVRILQTPILGELKGSLRGEAAVNLISHTEAVASGATVVTSGLDMFPAGLAIAAVTHVAQGANSLFQDVRAELLFDPAVSPVIFILKP